MTKKFEDERTVSFIAQHHPVLHEQLPFGKTIVESIHEITRPGLPMTQSLHILHDLRRNNYTVAIATNQSKKTFDHLVNSGVLPPHDHFATICTSNSIQFENEENGMKKVIF